MPSDPDLLSRLYGEAPPTSAAPRRRYGWAPALWLGGLLFMASAGFLVALSSGLAVATGAADTLLVRNGVFYRDERVLAYADEGTPASGCAVVTSGFLVTWHDEQPTGRVDLRGGRLVVEGGELSAGPAGASLSCLVGGQAATFVDAAAPFLAAPSPQAHPARDRRVDRYRIRR